MRRKLLVLLFVVLMLVPVGQLIADVCEDLLEHCLLVAKQPEPCYEEYLNCQDGRYF